MTTKKTQLRTHYAKLAKLDDQRRAIIREIKSHPSYAIEYIKDVFRAKANTWFVRDDGTGKPMDVTDPTRVICYIDIVVEHQDVNAGTRYTSVIKKVSSTIYNVTLTTLNLKGTTYNTHIQVSVDRPIIPQIYQSMHELTTVQLQKIQKELAKLEAAKAKQNQIQALEETIAKAQAELKKLKVIK